jgi:hypothetical protein
MPRQSESFRQQKGSHLATSTGVTPVGIFRTSTIIFIISAAGQHTVLACIQWYFSTLRSPPSLHVYWGKRGKDRGRGKAAMVKKRANDKIETVRMYML